MKAFPGAFEGTLRKRFPPSTVVIIKPGGTCGGGASWGRITITTAKGRGENETLKLSFDNRMQPFLKLLLGFLVKWSQYISLESAVVTWVSDAIKDAN